MAFRYTPGQHRHMAKRLRMHAGMPGWPSKEHTEEMAQNHETMASVIEGFIARGSISNLFRSPSIIPDWPEVEKAAPLPSVVPPQLKRKPPPFQLRFPGI
jgi:hypothetical protein